MKKKVYYVDIDDNICSHDKNIPLDGERNYGDAVPCKESINKINNLYNQGHTVVYWTARGSRSGKDWFKFTEKQLKEWGCLYHELRCDKPYYDKFIEDRSMLIEQVKVFISHRGNIDGENPFKENSPGYIDKAIDEGYDVEIDVRLIDDELWLGHDKADYPVELEWLQKRHDRLWIHAKNVEALEYLLEFKELRVFYHTSDDQTIISDGHIWTHDLNAITKKSIIPLLARNHLIERYKDQECYGICSDYVEHYKKEFNN
jgi:hypothetical protein